MKTSEIFANRLKIARKNIGLTQEELADKLGVSRGAIGHWEMGNREPNLEMLIKMSNLFDVSVEFLLGKTDLKNKTAVAEYIIDKMIDYNMIDKDNINLNMIDKYLEYIMVMQKINKEYEKKK